MPRWLAWLMHICPICHEPLEDGRCVYAEMDDIAGIDHLTGEDLD